MNDVQETIKDIKSKFRLYMNGVISQSMREKGMDYKLNFGIEYSRIKEIAAGYEKIMIWLRLFGRKTSVNARLWLHCFSLLILSVRK